MRDTVSIRSFASIKDLLDAREAYHIHLMAMTGVRATAIGLHRFRDGEPGYQRAVTPEDNHTKEHLKARQFGNSKVRDWSWPCVLVFVDQWRTPSQLKRGEGMYDLVPRLLYLSDGRAVPTCVIEAPLEETALSEPWAAVRNSHLIGGGYPVLADVQGEEHRGTIACLVSDGDSIYALTSRHVAGPESRRILVRLENGRIRLGESHRLQVGKLAFERAYPAWRGSHVEVNVDAGLIRPDDLNRVTAQVHGIGRLGEIFDISDDTLSLDLIGKLVRGFGGATGSIMHGQIEALFYRYKTIGGFESVAELLIGPRSGKALTSRPGDSGTLWVLDEPVKVRPGEDEEAARNLPIAMQWGGHVMMGNGGERSMRFVLASALSTICRELDVDLVRDLHADQVTWFGKQGHQSVAAEALSLLKANKHDAKLHHFLAQTSKAGGDEYLDYLAALPDDVGSTAGHTVRVDAKPAKGRFEGRDFRKVCEAEGFSLPLFAEFAFSFSNPSSIGYLPLFVGWLYQRMVEALREGRGDDFLCAAGALAHPLGDAASFGHIWKEGASSANNGLHSLFDYLPEKAQFNFERGLRATLAQPGPEFPAVRSANDAALLVWEHVALMARRLPLATLREVIEEDGKRGAKDDLEDLIKAKLREPILELTANAVRLLAHLWKSAWREGKGDKARLRLSLKSNEAFKKLYGDKKNRFQLPERPQLRQWVASLAAAPPRRKAPRRRAPVSETQHRLHH